MKYRIALIPGDGIGPELTEATTPILTAAQRKFGINLKLVELEAGDSCLERRGEALPRETIEAIKSSHTCLKGPVGETAVDVIVKLRIMLDLYANIRPIKAYPNTPHLRGDIDLIFVRENTEGLYRGIEFTINDTAIGVRIVTRKGCERIARKAFQLALKRNKKRKVTVIHKSNVMKLTCGLFVKTCREIAREYPSVTLEEQYVDSAAMRLIREPQKFDVIATTNMFGDILSDEAAQLVGGLGMAPGANIGEKHAIFEPIHGTAPPLIGKQIANPCSMILAAKMMLEWLGERHGDPKCLRAAEGIEKALIKTLRKGLVVPDLGGRLKTAEMGEAVAQEVMKLKSQDHGG